MTRRFRILGAVALSVAALAAARPAMQETPKAMTATYESVADSILAIKSTEKRFINALLGGHRHGAESRFKAGDFAGAAAEIALFANEGDNGVGGVRKRLVEGGHHHNAEGEAQGIYESGFVTVTRDAKKKALAASMALQQAKTDDDRKKAWADFAAIASDLLDKK